MSEYEVFLVEIGVAIGFFVGVIACGGRKK